MSRMTKGLHVCCSILLNSKTSIFSTTSHRPMSNTYDCETVDNCDKFAMHFFKWSACLVWIVLAVDAFMLDRLIRLHNAKFRPSKHVPNKAPFAIRIPTCKFDAWSQPKIRFFKPLSVRTCQNPLDIFDDKSFVAWSHSTHNVEFSATRHTIKCFRTFSARSSFSAN